MMLCAACVASAANYLTFTAEEDNSTFGIVNKKNTPNVQYSLDDGATWTDLVGGTEVTLVSKGDKALLRGDNPQGFSKKYQYSSFTMTGKVAVSGSVMSLVDRMGSSTEFPEIYCFCHLFENCTSLTQAPELPFTTLVEGCYASMFSGCTSLAQAPVLLATTLAVDCYSNMFRNCTGLTQAPALPVTSLAESCYDWMFSGCTSLTQAPALPATTLTNYCYYRMFSGCTSLTQAPALPATTLTEKCYYEMFSGCASLTQAPELPATTLANNCYYGMFSGCTNLTQAPELPATTLANYCYSDMFSNCVGLMRAPELPATTLAGGCYSNMFSGCVGLTRAPQLPATTLAGDCYKGMFSGCTNLSEINVSFNDWNAGNSTSGWAQNVAPTGTFICPETLTPGYGKSRIPVGWTVKNIVNGDTVDVPINYNFLTFTAEEDSSTFEIVNERKNNPNVQYSLDGGKTWTTLAGGDTVVLAHKGDKALLRGDNPQGFSTDSWYQYSTFKMTGKVAASGSVMSLIDGIGSSTEIPVNYCFYRLFKDCTSLTQAPELPATKLTEKCYMYMFEGCTSLTKAPELPATKLFYDCYDGMFENCTSLTQAPELPATDLAQGCYMLMFRGCTSLTQAPALPATTLSEWCYGYMFLNCTSLTQAPELPATKLLYSCYYGMFLGCNSLSEINVSFDVWTTIHEEGPETTTDWVKDVAPTGTFICPKTLSLEYGEDRIPEGWKVKYIVDGDTVDMPINKYEYLTFTAEEDGSTFGIVSMGDRPDVQYSLDGGETWTALTDGDTVILAHRGDKALLRGDNPRGFSWYQSARSYFTMTGKIAASGSVMSLIDVKCLSSEIPNKCCFYGLFENCTSLTQAPELSATVLNEECYAEMFSGCTSLTQAPALPATTLADWCYSGMFSRCANLTQAPELPATTLAGYCYARMFSSCTSLTQAPALPATTLEEFCYLNMFSGCTNLTQAPALPATTLADYCYGSMFSNCASLTQAPELPATALVGSCYAEMFSGCTNLSEIHVSFDDWLDPYSEISETTTGWVYNVAPTGTFICPKALALEYGISRIPRGWEVKYVEGEGSGVNSSLSDNITVWTDDLTIFVRGAEGEVSLYDMSGRRIAVSNTADEERALSVPAKGVYVVRTSGGERSVLVR